METHLSKDELIGIVNPEDEYNGQVAPRSEVVGKNMWHRTTSILVMNERGQYLVSKRSSLKDYCPGYHDICFGGVVNNAEMD